MVSLPESFMKKRYLGIIRKLPKRPEVAFILQILI